MFWKLIALIVPLGLDTFAVAVALAMAGLPKRERLRISVLFTAFEAGMPFVGLLIGAAVGQAIGQIADYVAIAALILLGAYMLWPRDEENERERLALLARTHGAAVLGLGLSISLDELAIGFTAGLLRLHVLLVLVWIAVQAFVVAQLGLRVGTRLGEAVREGAERAADWQHAYVVAIEAATDYLGRYHTIAELVTAYFANDQPDAWLERLCQLPGGRALNCATVEDAACRRRFRQLTAAVIGLS